MRRRHVKTRARELLRKLVQVRKRVGCSKGLTIYGRVRQPHPAEAPVTHPMTCAPARRTPPPPARCPHRRGSCCPRLGCCCGCSAARCRIDPKNRRGCRRAWGPVGGAVGPRVRGTAGTVRDRNDNEPQPPVMDTQRRWNSSAGGIAFEAQAPHHAAHLARGQQQLLAVARRDDGARVGRDRIQVRLRQA